MIARRPPLGAYQVYVVVIVTISSAQLSATMEEVLSLNLTLLSYVWHLGIGGFNTLLRSKVSKDM